MDYGLSQDARDVQASGTTVEGGPPRGPPRGGFSGRGAGRAGAPFARGAFPSSARGTGRGQGAPRGKPFPNRSATFGSNAEGADAKSSYASTAAAAAAAAAAAQEATSAGVDAAAPPASVAPTGTRSGTRTPTSTFYPTPAASAPSAPTQSAFRSAAVSASSSSSSPSHTSAQQTEEEDRKRRFQTTPHENRFLEMKAQRGGLREQYIATGVIPDPDKPQQLSEATKLRGTCMDMCPAFEREEREFQGEGDELEVFPGSTKLDPKLAVKIYRRPAAGRELPLPEDVRPPAVLRQTLDYLFYQLLPSSPASDRLAHVQGFIWNRTRAIRQDFIVQGEAGPLTVECHERIARWHILSLHWQGGSVDSQGRPRESLPTDRDPWSQQQELEQLAKTLTSLCEFYDDLRMTTRSQAPSPNEAEFRAYHLILNMFDPEIIRSVELLPEEVFDAPILQTAIKLRGFAQRANRGGSGRAHALNTDAPMNFFSRLTSAMRSHRVTYLLACLLENQLGQVREGALRALSSNYNKVHRGPAVPFVRQALAADSDEQVLQWAEQCNVQVQRDGPDGVPALKLFKGMEISTKATLSSFSVHLVENKRGSSTSQQIVDGVSSGAAPLLPLDGLGPVRPQLARPAPLPSAQRTMASSSLEVGHPAVKAPQSTFSASPTATSSAPFAAPVTQARQPVRTAPVTGPATGPAPGLFASTSNASVKAADSLSPFAPAFVPQQPQVKPAPAFPAFASAPLPKAAAEQPSEPFKGVQKPFSFATAASSAQPFAASQKQVQSEPSSQITRPAATSTATAMTAATPAVTSRAKEKVTLQRRQSEARLLQTLLLENARAIAQKAITAEKQSRRAEERSALLSHLTHRFFESLRDDIIPERASEHSREAVAGEASHRSIKKRCWLVWIRRLQRLRQARQQQERLDFIRRRIAERKLSVGSKTLHAAGKHGRTLSDSPGASKPLRLDDEDDGDDLLRASFSAFKKERTHLWAEGTFMVAVAHRVLDVISRWRPIEMYTWAVLLCLPPGDISPADGWLKHKFGFSRELQEKTIPLTQDTTLRGQVVAGEASNVEHHDTGMVFFSLSTRLAEQELSEPQRDELWSQEASRLREMGHELASSRNRFVPLLVVIDWRSQGDAQGALTALGLSSHAHPPWADVALVSLGQANDADATFAAAITTVLSEVKIAPRRHAVTLAEVLDAFYRPWTDTAVLAQTMISPLLQAGKAHEQAPLARICVDTLATMSALANYALNCILQSSETLIEDESTLLLPKVDIDALLNDCEGAASVNEILFCAGQQLARSGGGDDGDDGDEDDSFSLTQAVLLQAQRQGQPFPLAVFVEALLRSRILLLEESWLGLYDDEDLLQSDGRLNQDIRRLEEWASDSLALLAQSLRTLSEASRPDVSAPLPPATKRRKRETLASDDAASDVGTPPKPVAKRAKDDGQSEGDFAPTPEVDRLRRLIANAKALLSQSQPSATPV
ncbi:unnamed protein product [Parajaminaea phylloscopi]